MARPRKYERDAVLDAALEVLQKRGARGTTVEAVAAALGAPNGSVYYRFASRDLLLVELWLRTVARFQDGYIASLEAPEVRTAAQAAARFVVGWARRHAAEARLLLLYRREDLVRGRWPRAVSQRAEALAEQLDEALRRFARRVWPNAEADLIRVEFALIRVPYAAVHHDLVTGRPVPAAMDDLVAETVDAVLNLGTRPDAKAATRRSKPSRATAAARSPTASSGRSK